MKLLLTSGGIKNDSSRTALVELLGKPFGESSALVIPTATYAMGGPAVAWRVISGAARTPLCELGWKSIGVLELTALPSLDKAHWIPWVEETDVLLVAGGDALYLSYWMRESGLADLLPSLRAVYVGVSGGSMALAPQVGEEFIAWKPPTGRDRALGLVEFSIFPHLDHPSFPENSMAGAEKWASSVSVSGYAIDDQTAVKVTEGAVDVVSEGHWKLFSR
ncbi:MAG: Type 1 glutamine amidotransferase-like domain-containing protein [Clostridia bacterium]